MKEEIRVQVFKIEPMSKQGLKRWSPEKRAHIQRTVYKGQKAKSVSTKEFNSIEKIRRWIFKNYGKGTYQIRTPVPNKHARLGMSMKKLLDIEVTPNPNYPEIYGHATRINQTRKDRLNRYKKILQWKEQ